VALGEPAKTSLAPVRVIVETVAEWDTFSLAIKPTVSLQQLLSPWRMSSIDSPSVSISMLEAPPFLPSRSPPHPLQFIVSSPFKWHKIAASFIDTSFIGFILTTLRPFATDGRVIDEASSSGSAQPLPSAVPEMTRWAWRVDVSPRRRCEVFGSD